MWNGKHFSVCLLCSHLLHFQHIYTKFFFLNIKIICRVILLSLGAFIPWNKILLINELYEKSFKYLSPFWAQTFQDFNILYKRRITNTPLIPKLFKITHGMQYYSIIPYFKYFGKVFTSSLKSSYSNICNIFFIELN